MKSLKRFLIPLMLCIVSLAFMGCNKAGIDLTKAIEKNKNIKDYSFESNATAKVDLIYGNPLGNEITKYFPMEVKFDMKGKSQQELDKYKKSEMDLDVDLMDLRFGTKIYTDINLNEDNTNIKLLCEIPRFAKAALGLSKSDVKYMYCDTESANEYSKDLGEYYSSNSLMITEEQIKEIEDKYKEVLEIIKDSIKVDDLITSKGFKKIEINGKKESVKIIEVSLNKKAVKEIINSVIEDENIVKAFLEVALITEQEEEKTRLIEQALENMKADAAKVDEALESVFTEIDDKSSINLTFGIKNGYIVYENVDTDIILSNKAKIDCDFEMKIYDINKDIEVKFPELKKGSYIDIYKYSMNKVNYGNEYENGYYFELPALSVKDYFQKDKNSVYHYSGGYDNAGYTTCVEVVENDTIQMKFTDKADSFIYVYKVTDDEIVVVKGFDDDSEEVENYINEKSSNEYSNKVLINPKLGGEGWQNDSGSISYVTNVNTLIETPVGSYETIEVCTILSEESYVVSYYAKNIGLVKQVYNYYGDTLESVLTKIEEK